MTYLNAPQTSQLASNCAVCGRPLCDAASVTAGVGPVCRERYGYNEIPESLRVEANAVIHKIARSGSSAAEKVMGINALRAMGLMKIADKLGEYHATAVITRTVFRANSDEVSFSGRNRNAAMEIVLKSKFSPALVSAVRRVSGRRWVKSKKVNTFPASSGQALLQALNAAIAGEICYGPKGAFVA